MIPSAAELLRVQLRHAWSTARRSLVDLDEDEYWWEPATPCWSVRPRSAAVRGWGQGPFCCEDAWPAPDPLPTTTIAWKVIHLAAWTDVYRGYAFEGSRPDLMDVEIPGDMEGGLTWLSDAQDAFLAALDDVDDEALFALRPAHWGESVPLVRLVATLLTEHVHHLAEIGVLRDLRRGHARQVDPDPAVGLPTWWTGG